jgi:hypothetical protein
MSTDNATRRIGPARPHVFEVLPGRSIRIITYGCTLAGTFAPRVSEEHSEYRLCPVGELDGLSLPDGYRRSIETWSGRPAKPLAISLCRRG